MGDDIDEKYCAIYDELIRFPCENTGHDFHALKVDACAFLRGYRLEGFSNRTVLNGVLLARDARRLGMDSFAEK